MVKEDQLRAAIVYNPVKVDLDELRAAVNAAEQEAGYGPTTWLETSEEDPGASMARKAVDQGVALVLAAGGDGTVRAVAEGLRGTKVPLGLLPHGTGNLLARNLKVELSDTNAAVRAAFLGTDRPVDLGVAQLVLADGSQEEHCFVVLAGIGLDAQMIANTDEDLKAKAGWLAYVKAIGAAVRGGRRIKARYRVTDDDRWHVLRLHTLMVGNCGSLPGDVLLLPDAAVDSGHLDAVFLRPKGVFGWIQIVGHIFIGNKLLRRRPDSSPVQDGSKDVRPLRYLKAEQIEVQVRDPEPFDLDGDLFGDVRGFTCSLDADGLLVRMPGTAA